MRRRDGVKKKGGRKDIKIIMFPSAGKLLEPSSSGAEVVPFDETICFCRPKGHFCFLQDGTLGRIHPGQHSRAVKL